MTNRKLNPTDKHIPTSIDDGGTLTYIAETGTPEQMKRAFPDSATIRNEANLYLIHRAGAKRHTWHLVFARNETIAATTTDRLPAFIRWREGRDDTPFPNPTIDDLLELDGL